MEVTNFRHEHPLLFTIREEQSNPSEAIAAYCSMCGEAVLGPSFSCAECGIYLHKQCGEAPSQINHPFHRSHPLILLPNAPYRGKRYYCNFCGEIGQSFVYHCSCNIDLHIKCVLFTYKIGEKSFGELQSFGYKDPSNSSTGDDMEELGSAKCFGCWEPLIDAVYYSLDCGFKLHKKCVHLPLETNHPFHRKHPLFLQFNGEIFSCIICQNNRETNRLGFIYCCSPCNFVIHIKCLSPPSVIEDKGHPHPFTQFFRELSFTCDACGREGKCFPYTCSECNLLVHKECISLPRIIKFMWHQHPISHTYFLPGQTSESWDCVVCLDKVDTDYGSYSCLDCHFIGHVNCVMMYKADYYVVESEKMDENVGDSKDVDSVTVIERNEDGEATIIKHFGHVHNLMSSNMVVEEDHKYCDGCTLSVSVSDPCYYCSQCDFVLHKKCAEFPKKLYMWFHICQQLFTLVPDRSIFKCSMLKCQYVCNGFFYQCDKCGITICLRCTIPYTLTHQGHEHPLSYSYKYQGPCNACGNEIDRCYGYKCKRCNFAVHGDCLQLPLKAPHKCDEHLLALTYHDDEDDYSERDVCDICEKERNPSHWFYHCTTCDNSAHTKCALGRYPFIKLGKIYNQSHHPHPLIFVKKFHSYPECLRCSRPCRDLALQCEESECGYIVHWDCIAPRNLKEYRTL